MSINRSKQAENLARLIAAEVKAIEGEPGGARVFISRPDFGRVKVEVSWALGECGEDRQSTVAEVKP